MTRQGALHLGKQHKEEDLSQQAVSLHGAGGNSAHDQSHSVLKHIHFKSKIGVAVGEGT